jgi:hypothetical protein
MPHAPSDASAAIPLPVPLGRNVRAANPTCHPGPWRSHWRQFVNYSEIKRAHSSPVNESSMYNEQSRRKIVANLLQRVGLVTMTSGHQTQGFRSPAWCSQLRFMHQEPDPKARGYRAGWHDLPATGFAVMANSDVDGGASSDLPVGDGYPERSA